MENISSELRSMLELIIKNLVDKPEDVVVLDTVSHGNTIVFTINVAKNEVGKVIGRDGRIARALRVIIESAATKYKHRAILEIADD